MIDLDTVFTGLKQLEDVLNTADQLMPVVFSRCTEMGVSAKDLDPVQSMMLVNDLIKIMTPLNDRLLELQTTAFFREMQPPGNPLFTEHC
jgi:hypothetical protein